MKKLLYLMSLLLLGFHAVAQNKTADIITKVSGEKIEADVKEVTDTHVSFTYAGETALYNLNRSDIQEIRFRSGRVETFGSVDNASGQNSGTVNADHGNKVAVLPFIYVSDGQSDNSEMSIMVQTDCYTYLTGHAGNYSIMDVHTTNALLAKAGINKETIPNFTMDEVCNTLGVAFVVTGMVTLDRTSQTSYGSSSQNASYKKNDDKKKNTSSSFGSSYTTTEQNYETSLTLNIYNQNRKAFWHQKDAYKNTLEYLLKRSPLYKK